MATIIKSDVAPQSSGTSFRGVAFDFTDMAAQADDYVRVVQRDAARIVDDARREAAAIRQAAEAAGRQAAEQAIERILDEKVARQMQTLTPALRSAVGQIEDAKQDWLCHWEQTALQLAARIAERLVRGELTRRPEITLQWIRESLELCAGAAEVTIALNPADHASLVRQTQQLAEAFAPAAKVRIEAIDGVAPGGCKITTEFGEIDGQVSAQLARVLEELN